MNVKSAIVAIAFLQLLDIIFTYKILSIYIKLNPEDKNWPELEFNKRARDVFKKYGLGKTGFMIQIISTTIIMSTFFAMIYILNFDLEFFTYAIFGGLTYVNIHHYNHYYKLKEQLIIQIR